MSRVANMPVNIPEKVEVVISQDNVQVKGPLGELTGIFATLDILFPL